MRKELKPLKGQRLTFTAMVVHYGKKSAFRGPDLDTILLEKVARKDTGEILCDHLWFTAGKSWQELSPGDRTAFDARVDTYVKGYKGRREEVYNPISRDYRLTRPTKVVLLERIGG